MKIPRIAPVLAARVRRIVPWASLATGLWSAFFVARRYEQARRVAWLLGAAWLALALVALLRRDRRGEKRRRWAKGAEFALSWAGQSASQEILFFVLPFWVRSTTWGSRNALFTSLLLLLGVTVLVDAVYARIQSSVRAAVLHKSMVQFAALAFLVPTLSGAHTSEALALAGAISGGTASLSGRSGRPWLACAAGVFLGAALPVLAESWIAPVPLRVEHAVFSSKVAGRAPVDTLRSAPRGRELWAWTPVFAPAGLRDTLLHRWERDGREVATVRLPLRGGRKEGFRTWSSSALAASARGEVALTTLTADGQIVGRMTISVAP
jgi:hypothetical protein